VNGGRERKAIALHDGRTTSPHSMTISQYETSNVYLAAFLLCQGATLLGFERVSPRRNLFRFASDEALHNLLRLYWQNVPFTIVPTKLFDSLKELKSRTRLRPTATSGQSTPPQPATPPEEVWEGAQAPIVDSSIEPC
jgi:Domain of unknown function (DUF5659)